MAGQVWYDTLVNGQLSARASFESFAQATVTSARRLFTNDPSVAEKVGAAWVEVGVLDAGVDLAAYQPGRPALPSAPAALQGDRATSQRRSPYAAVVALPAPRRSGSWTSTADPEGPEVRHLLMRVGMQRITSTRPTPGSVRLHR